MKSNHVGDGVAARAADADHADPGLQLVHFGRDEFDAHLFDSYRFSPAQRSAP
jgi:hypothetical protein